MHYSQIKNMETAQDFQNKLSELQNEQRILLSSPDRRKKVVRERIKQITADFYATKELWRTTLGPTTSF